MNRRQLQREAVLAAEFALADLDLPAGSRVPVFDMIEDRGIWLSFHPLDRLLGAYHRIDDVAGIAVNTARPLALQRFTAAHELGHHELGHTSHVDDYDDVQSPSNDPQEIQAQTYAASLLMSELSVETRLLHRGHDPSHPQLDAVDVYRLSAELGVSYLAMVTQLRALDKIGAPLANELGRQSPLALKQGLLGGRRPDNPRASVWRLTPSDRDRHIIVDVGDELDLALPEPRTAGYEWVMRDDTTDAFTPVRDRYVAAAADTDPPRIGATGTRHLTLKAHRTGMTKIAVDLRQPWDGGDHADTFVVSVTVTAMPTSEVGQGISINQQSQLLAA